MKKLLAVTTLFFALQSTAQNESGYESAVGVKISSGVAASYKKFVSGNNAIEAQGMFFKEGARFVGLYEFHFYNIEGLSGLGWYIGPGAHLGVWKKNYKEQYNSSLDLGIDGVIGLDYRIKNTPINLSLDWQPSFSILGNAGLMPQFGGIAIRYVLK